MGYTVLLVEDERIERDALAVMLKLNRKDIRPVLEAGNGLEAVRLFREHQPDIVLMDVNLPGINGLDAVREMQQISGYAKYIIVSAHNTFHYAQQALRLGIVEYLLKPIQLSELCAALDAVIETLESHRHREASSHHLSQRLEALRPVLESDFLYALIDTRSDASFDTLSDFFSEKIHGGFVFALRTSQPQRHALLRIRQQLKNIGVYCIGEIMGDILVFAVLSTTAHADDQVEEITAYVERLMCEIPQTYIGVGAGGSTAAELRRSYQQAMRALAFAQQHNQCRARSVSPEGEPFASELEMVTTVKKLTAVIHLYDKSGVVREVQTLFSEILAGCYSHHTYCELVYRIYILVCGNFPEVYGHTLSESGVTLDALSTYRDVPALSDFMIGQYLQLTQDVQNTRIAQPDSLIGSALQQIQTRYMENISLTSVAKTLNITPIYLSKLVKRHTGQNYTDLLTACRLEEAKKLLLGKDLNMKEISFAVGFHSQAYFTKSFKKYTGIAPSDFRLAYLQKKELSDS